MRISRKIRIYVVAVKICVGVGKVCYRDVIGESKVHVVERKAV